MHTRAHLQSPAHICVIWVICAICQQVKGKVRFGNKAKFKKNVSEEEERRKEKVGVRIRWIHQRINNNLKKKSEMYTL